MSAGKKRPLAIAQDLAKRLIDTLGPACQRIEVAGSVRRGSPLVGDVELVVIPRYIETGLFAGASQESCLNMALGNLIDEGRLTAVKGGSKFIQFTVGRGGNEIRLDLHIVTSETWGVKLALTTGPEDYSKAIVTQRCYGGLLRNGLIVGDGNRVWRCDDVVTELRPPCPQPKFIEPHTGAAPLDTPEEADYLALAGGWVEPTQRDLWWRHVQGWHGGKVVA